MKSDFNIDVKWFGKAASDEVISAAMKGLRQGGLTVAGDARKITPVDTGTLMRSICVSEGGVPNLNNVYAAAKTSVNQNSPIVLNGKQGDEMSVHVTANTPYAHRQHETHATKSKFLEKSLQENKDIITKLVTSELNRL